MYGNMQAVNTFIKIGPPRLIEYKVVTLACDKNFKLVI